MELDRGEGYLRGYETCEHLPPFRLLCDVAVQGDRCLRKLSPAERAEKQPVFQLGCTREGKPLLKNNIYIEIANSVETIYFDP